MFLIASLFAYFCCIFGCVSVFCHIFTKRKTQKCSTVQYEDNSSFSHCLMVCRMVLHFLLKVVVSEFMKQIQWENLRVICMWTLYQFSACLNSNGLLTFFSLFTCTSRSYSESGSWLEYNACGFIFFLFLCWFAKKHYVLILAPTAYFDNGYMLYLLYSWPLYIILAYLK